MHASATGESSRHSRLSCDAAPMNNADMTTTKVVASVMDIRPAGISRLAVRGFQAISIFNHSRIEPRAENLHVTFGIVRRPEPKPRIETMRVARHELKPAQPLQFRVLHHEVNHPLSESFASMLLQHVHIAEI